MFLAGFRIRTDTKHAELTLEHDFNSLRQELRQQGWHADAEIQIHARLDFLRSTLHDFITHTFLVGNILFSLRRLIGTIVDELFDTALEFLADKHAVNENAWRVNHIGVEFAVLDNLFDLSDFNPTANDRVFVEVTRRSIVVEVALSIGLLRLHDREITLQGFFHNIRSAIEHASLKIIQHSTELTFE